MRTVIQANFCLAQVQDGVVVVGFTDDELEPRDYLLLQKSISPDAQDRTLGHDQVHLTFCDQARSAYGGIRQFILEEGKAEIFLDSETASILRTTQHLDIRFPPIGLPLSVLRQHLETMFAEENAVFVFRERE